MVKYSGSPFILLVSDTFNCAELGYLFLIVLLCIPFTISILYILYGIYTVLRPLTTPYERYAQRWRRNRRPNRRLVNIEFRHIIVDNIPHVAIFDKLDPSFRSRVHIFRHHNLITTVYFNGVPHLAIKKKHTFQCLRHDLNRGVHIQNSQEL